MKLLIDGTVSISPQVNGDLELTINGTYTDDDDNNKQIVAAMGYEAIVDASEKDDLLAAFKVSELVDHIITGCDRNDVMDAYKELKKECDVYDLSS